MTVANFAAFINERHQVYNRKLRGLPWPWTKDPILQQYRFCNVYRNLDKETILLHTNWLSLGVGNEWFASAVARLVNWWPSLEGIGYPAQPWDPKRFVKVLDARRAAGQKVFTGAYMVRADAVIGGTKAAYLAEFVLSPLWSRRAYVAPKAGDTLDSFHKRLMEFRDMGSFMAAQVVADAKYFDPHLKAAADWGSWAASGPGSRRGLNRVLRKPVDSPWSEEKWRIDFSDVLRIITPVLRERYGLPAVTGQDLQNCLCEFDKYERVRLGQGTPRSKYQHKEVQ